MRIASVFSVTITLIVTSGCSQNDQKPISVSYQTPQYEPKNLGYIVEISATDVPTLEKHFRGRVEIISTEKRIFKVVAESESEIFKALPHATIQPNILLGDKEKLRSPAFEALAVEVKENPPAVDMAKCQEGVSSPQPKIELTNAESLKGKNGTFEKNQILKLSGGDSSGASEKLRLGWYLVAPGENEPKGPLASSPQWELKVDTVGEYQIGLLVQDENDVCGLTVIKLGITSNPQLAVGANREHPLLNEMDQKFDHLAVLHAENAWSISRGEGQIIAILDSGVNYNHSYLNGNILTNSKEIPDNGKDDDENGLIDDYIGWDYVQDDGAPFDDLGHGSHVAGLAAAEEFGLAPKAKILPVKVIDENGLADMARATAAIYYAIHRGAKIINASFGGPMDPQQPRETLRPVTDAFAAAEKAGVIVVTAAGNGTRTSTGAPIGLNTDVVPHLPASLPNINNITVAAVDFKGNLTPYSNYGKTSVRVAAPGGIKGQSIFSAKQENSQGDLFWGAEGTSMAAPIVAGIVALVRATNPKLTLPEINNVLLSSGSEVPALKGKLQSGRILDAFEAVSNAKNKPKPKSVTASSLAKRG